MPKTQNNLNSHISLYIGMCLVWPPLKTITTFLPTDSFWKGVFSTTNHKSAIISYFNVWFISWCKIKSLFLWILMWPKENFQRALSLGPRAGRPVKSVGPYISARFSWESHIILEESSPVIKSGPLKLLLHCTAFFLCFLDFRLGS